MSSLFCRLQACSATANSMHFMAKCEFKFDYRHTGWLNHQDEGLCCMFSLVKGIQELKYFFHVL